MSIRRRLDRLSVHQHPVSPGTLRIDLTADDGEGGTFLERDGVLTPLREVRGPLHLSGGPIIIHLLPDDAW
jgi:hypothetical protein